MQTFRLLLIVTQTSLKFRKLSQYLLLLHKKVTKLMKRVNEALAVMN